MPAECRFQDTNSRWTVNQQSNIEDGCNNEEFCKTAAHLENDDCNYHIKPIKNDNFGAEVSGLSLG